MQQTSTAPKRRGIPADPERQARWQRLVTRWQSSGRGVRPFCRRHGLKETSFYFWRRELARRQSQAGRRHQAASFVELQPVEDPPAAPGATKAPLELCLESGRRLLIHPGCDRHLLGEVLAALAAEGKRRPC